MVNKLTVEQATAIHHEELNKRARQPNGDEQAYGYRCEYVTTRNVKPGEEPFLTIPEDYLSGPIKLRQARVSHITLRSQGFIIPEDRTVYYSCGLGRKREGTQRCCLDPYHVTIGTVKGRFEPLCAPYVICDCGCNYIMKVCSHRPECTNGLANRYIKQEEAKSNKK